QSRLLVDRPPTTPIIREPSPVIAARRSTSSFIHATKEECKRMPSSSSVLSRMGAALAPSLVPVCSSTTASARRHSRAASREMTREGMAASTFSLQHPRERTCSLGAKSSSKLTLEDELLDIL
ncbi:hypothetical protein PMAYCL1PPCAC_04307, partial [Pristionchus mayeri]